MKDEKSNNLVPGSEEGTTKDKTGLDEKDKGGEKLLAGKFKSNEELVKAYQNLEADNTRKSQEASKLGERLAKLEGAQEMLQKQAQKAPLITAEERQKMTDQFKDDFNKDPLVAFHNLQRPYVEEINRQREELRAFRDESRKERERRGELVGLADKAREEDPEFFDKLKPEIEKELREDGNLGRYENPYTAAFYKVVGKSYKRLAKGTDAERESFVEGPSLVPPEKGKLTKEQAYKDFVVKEKGRSTRLT